MSEADSFIEEVTEEVKRDRLYAIARRYGWIAVLVVLVLVGGAAFNEWRKADARTKAEALGDSVLAAIADEDLAARSAALAAIQSPSAQAQVFLDMFEAAAQVEADDVAAALTLLDQIAANPEAPETYRHLARLKAVITRGADQDRTERLAILDTLSTPGNPFRVMALEQIALVHYEFGNNDDAIATLRTILDEPEATQGLLQRAQQLIVALGGTLSDPESDQGNDQ